MIFADIDQSPLVQHFNQFVEFIFGGDRSDPAFSVCQVAARSVIIYLAGVVVVRIGKSRLVSRVTSLDIIVSFILGSLLSRGITGHASISGTVVASAAIVAMHWVLTALAFHWHWFGVAFKGNTVLLVDNGQPQQGALRHSHLSTHDLIEGLRLRGIEDLDEVKHAYKERNGEISVIAKHEPRVLDIVVRDGVQTVRIELT